MAHPNESSIGWLLAQTARLHRFHLNEKLAGMGLFAGQEQVLQALDNQGALTMGELASILRVRVPTASKAVTRLAALGFVERQSNGKDRRSVRVKLTHKGETASARIHALWDKVETDMVAGLTPRRASAYASSFCEQLPILLRLSAATSMTLTFRSMRWTTIRHTLLDGPARLAP